MKIEPGNIVRVVRCDPLPMNVGRIGVVVGAATPHSYTTPDGIEHFGGHPGNHYWAVDGAFVMPSNVGPIETRYAVFDERCLRRIDPSDAPDETLSIVGKPEPVAV